MRTECCNCDRPATRFVGEFPYCGVCRVDTTSISASHIKPTSLQIDTLLCGGCRTKTDWKDIIKCSCGRKVCRDCFHLRDHRTHARAL